jgi:phosphatidylserine/phosphatidylglycerophosphate/cardiolipin synthase-like enzyme
MIRFIVRSIVCSLIVAAILGYMRRTDFSHVPSLHPTFLSSSLSSFSLNRVSAASAGTPGLHYSPDENVEHVDIKLIEESRGPLDIAAYSFTNQAFARAVLAAANRGQHVRIYRDYQQYTEEEAHGSYVSALFRGNRNIEIRVKRSRDLMHLKAFSDGNFLRDGSANFSASAKHQDNSVIITKDAAQIREYSQKFGEMWSRPGNIVIQ